MIYSTSNSIAIHGLGIQLYSSPFSRSVVSCTNIDFSNRKTTQSSSKKKAMAEREKKKKKKTALVIGNIVIWYISTFSNILPINKYPMIRNYIVDFGSNGFFSSFFSLLDPVTSIYKLWVWGTELKHSFQIHQRSTSTSASITIFFIILIILSFMISKNLKKFNYLFDICMRSYLIATSLSTWSTHSYP